MPEFVQGLELARRFYWEAVRPVLDAAFPGLPHAAALLGPGSEVLGFDSEMSSDHHWGPRAMLFLGEEDHTRLARPIRAALGSGLPHQLSGYPTNFTRPDPADRGTQLLHQTDSGPVNHRVEVLTVRGYFLDYLGYDPAAAPSAPDWLSFPEHKLLSLTRGQVFYDVVGLEVARAQLAYYPEDVWLYVLASAWARIGEEEHLMGRAGSAGDELGSALIGARLVRDVMRLCFLMERRYAPYAKWFGTAFAKLRCGPALAPLLKGALRAAGWPEREEHLVQAYARVAAQHNALGITEPMPEAPSAFFGRPYRVIHGQRFADAIVARIADPEMLRMVARGLTGNVDLFSDNTYLLSDTQWQPRLRQLFA